MWLTRWAMRNPITVLMVCLAMVVLGAISLSRLPVDLFPQINLPIITVGISYQGAAPTDIERSVVYQLEKAIMSASGVQHVESTSREGVGIIQAWFNFDTNLDADEVAVIQQVQRNFASLPKGVSQPFVLKFDISNIPVASVMVNGGGLDERQLYDLAYNVIEPQLEQVPGVSAASVSGGRVREIEISLDPQQLQARGLTLADAVAAVNNANFILPSGNLRAGKLDYNVFTNTQYQAIDPLRDLVVKVVNGVPVRVQDVGQVSDSYADQTQYVRENGTPGVQLRVNKIPGANTVNVVDALRKQLGQLVGVPHGVNVQVSFDQSTYIRNAIASLKSEALMGSVLATLVILIFLRSFSSTLIVALAIPLSIVVTFILLYFTGQTLNIFTLGGLALGVGRLVDDSIVELENISRHRSMGKTKWRATLDAAQEVAMPILASTITTIVVFMPVVFITGVTRYLFVPLTLTISISLIVSFFVSRTVTPLLCTRILQAEPEHELDSPKLTERFWARVTRGLAWLDQKYQNALGASLRHPRWVVGGIVAFFVGTLFLVPFIGSEFIPATDESQFSVSVRLPVGTRAEVTNATLMQMEDVIRHDVPANWISAIITEAGYVSSGIGAVFGGNTGPHSGNLHVNLVPPGRRSESQEQIVTRIRKDLVARFPGLQIAFYPGGIVTHIINFGSDAPIDVEVYGYDFAKAADLAARAADILRSTRGLADVMISRESNYPELHVNVDRAKAEQLGLSEHDIATTVLYSLKGSSQVQPIIYTDPGTGNEYNINVRLAENFRDRPDDLGGIALRTANGQPVLLRDVATVTRSAGPVTIQRKYLQRVIHVTANPKGRPLGDIASELRQKFKNLAVPPGFTVKLGGQVEQQQQTFKMLLLASALAILLVYMVMASQFQSLLDPFIIMFSVPLGFTGVIWALFLTGTTFSTTSFMGVIMMVGIVVSNGVLLVDYTNKLRERGVDLDDAVILGGRTRLRPILMTTLATVLGLLPMALGIEEGSESNAPLARAVIGGLLVSTFLTLFLIPLLYTFFEKKLPRRKSDVVIEMDEELARSPAAD
ncbi:MAG: efflux RND transporter permease subunit [Terriglobales bacterium]